MKHSLDDEVAYDFSLIGISCHEKDYRMCWGINTHTPIFLERSAKELQTFPSKKNPKVSYHTLFSSIDIDAETAYHLIVNRTADGCLIPEKPEADYLFMIIDNGDLNLEELMQQIRSISFVQTAFIVDVESLRSKDNLLF